MAANDLNELSEDILKDAGHEFFLLFASLNPFKGLSKQSTINARIWDTYGVFAGSEEAPLKHGIFGTLLGLPMQFVYFLVPSLFIVTGFLAFLICAGAAYLFELETKKTWYKLLTKSLAILFMIIGVGLGLASIIGYVASKIVLWPINELIIRGRIIPFLSKLSVGLVSPIIGLVHIIGMLNNKQLEKNQSALGNTLSTIIKESLSNFKLLASSSLNPFKGIHPAHRSTFTQRMQDTSTFFGGTSNDKKWWEIPQRTNRGIFGTLIGWPIQLAHSVVQLPVLLLLTPGIILTSATISLWNKAGNLPYLGRILASPLALLLGATGIGLMTVGLIGAAASHLVNHLVQGTIIPILAKYSTLAVSPLVYVAHLIGDREQTAAIRKDTQEKYKRNGVEEPSNLRSTTGNVFREIGVSDYTSYSSESEEGEEAPLVENEESNQTHHICLHPRGTGLWKHGL